MYNLPNMTNINVGSALASSVAVEKYHCTKRILIVDDEPFNLNGLKIIFKMTLKRMDIDPRIMDDIIDSACNGKEALNRVQRLNQEDKGQYALIFMDCSMPIMDGYEATCRIRQFYQSNEMDQPYIVACTGHTEEEFIRKAWHKKMDEVIPKPAGIE